MPLALRFSVVALLSLFGVAGLAQWRLLPPPAMRTGASTDRVLADLASQEALQDGRARATEALGQFVGGQITRYFWGSFTGYLDVLGLKTPEDMEARINEAPERVQLLLIPRGGDERYLAQVQAEDNVPRGVACSGRGEPGSFRLERDALHCPPGWSPLELPTRRPADRRG
jgi:hypothetical protein